MNVSNQNYTIRIPTTAMPGQYSLIGEVLIDAGIPIQYQEVGFQIIPSNGEVLSREITPRNSRDDVAIKAGRKINTEMSSVHPPHIKKNVMSDETELQVYNREIPVNGVLELSLRNRTKSENKDGPDRIFLLLSNKDLGSSYVSDLIGCEERGVFDLAIEIPSFLIPGDYVSRGG